MIDISNLDKKQTTNDIKTGQISPEKISRMKFNNKKDSFEKSISEQKICCLIDDRIIRNALKEKMEMAKKEYVTAQENFDNYNGDDPDKLKELESIKDKAWDKWQEAIEEYSRINTEIDGDNTSNFKHVLDSIGNFIDKAGEKIISGISKLFHLKTQQK